MILKLQNWSLLTWATKFNCVKDLKSVQPTGGVDHAMEVLQQFRNPDAE